MKGKTSNSRKKEPIPRHRILVFKEEVRMIPVPRKTLNPLFLQAHDYETFRTLQPQSN